jgi:hypothetical protein
VSSFRAPGDVTPAALAAAAGSGGAFLHGVAIEGAAWDGAAAALAERAAASPGAADTALPLLRVEPRATAAPRHGAATGGADAAASSVAGAFLAPLYVDGDDCSEDAPGQHRSVVAHVPLPTRTSATHWLSKGVALRCSA